MRPNRTELWVTKLEFVTRRNFGRGRRSKVIYTADVGRLEFRHGVGLGETGELKSGLYAVKSRGSACLLPYLSYSETQEVIAAIATQFPGLAERWREGYFAAPGPTDNK